LEVAAGAVAEALTFIAADVLPVLIPIQAAFMIWQVRRHYKHMTHHSKEFTQHMVLKSDCMIAKLSDHTLGNGLTLKEDIGELCTADFASELEQQIQAVTRAKIEVFEQIASIGRCLWPHGDRHREKVECIETIYFKLLQYNGKSGILYSILAFMAYYGYRVDELLTDPFYRHWYQEEFGIENHAADVSLLPQLLKVKDEPLVKRLPVCMQLMATHRAFEMTFVRMKGALRVWMQSFARSFRHASMRVTWWPCQKVFHSMADFDEGMCKHEDWHIGHGKAEEDMNETLPCVKAVAYTGSLWPETEAEGEHHEHDEHDENK